MDGFPTPSSPLPSMLEMWKETQDWATQGEGCSRLDKV